MNPILIAVISAIVGGLVTYVFNKIGSKSSRFIYRQAPNTIAVAANDAVFGNVSVTWQGTEVTSLYFTVIEIENASYKDFKDVTVKVYCGNDLFLLTNAAILKDTTQILNLSSNYLAQIGHTERERTQTQRHTFNHSLEYVCPIINRGQTMQINILSTSTLGQI